jgi:penicillin G amidase
MTIGARIKVFIAVLAFFLLTGCVKWLIEKGFPAYSGVKYLDGLNEPVQVYRDDYGIPHIYAENGHDLYFCQGYIHAQDRLWQMETFRRLMRGRTAEVGGKELADLDMFMYMLRSEETAERISHLISEETEKVLNAYVRGINAYISHNKHDLPLEFESLGLLPSPYTRKDAFSTVILISWFLNQNYSEELFALQAMDKIPLPELARLFPAYPAPLLDTEIENLKLIRDWDVAPLLPAAQAFKNLFQTFGGSNNWAVDGKHTADGKPLLANDPHLVHTVPSFWYVNHLHAPGMHVAGASIAGTPGVAIGHNRDAAWAITNLMADYVDLYVVRVDPDDPFRYFWEGKYRDMKKEEILLPVKGSEPRLLTIFRTEAGPILSQVGEGEAQVVLKWLGEEEDYTMDAFLRMNQAGCAVDIMEAGRGMNFVSANLVAADKEGHIAWHATGRVPIRNGYSGFWPVAFESKQQQQWTGFIPYDELPSVFDPPGGMIITANEKRTGPDYPYHISYSFGSPHRAQRIRQRLEAKSNWSEQGFMAVQNDVYSLRADSFLYQIKHFRPRSESARWAWETLQNWDRQVRSDSLGAVVYEVFIFKIMEHFLQDDLGDVLYYYFDNIYKSCFLDEFNNVFDSPLWDKLDTRKRENYTDIIDLSLQDTVLYLENELGEKRIKWTWGQLHQIYYRHPGAQSWITRQLLNVGPFPMGGDNTTVNVAGFNPFYGRYNVNVIPSMRMIANLNNTEQSFFIGSMGQSGQPQHPHYSDMIMPWRAGEYLSLNLNRTEVMKSRESLLVLRPGK